MVITFPSIDGSFNFMCLVDGIAPSLLRVGLPNKMLYAEGAFTTREASRDGLHFPVHRDFMLLFSSLGS